MELQRWLVSAWVGRSGCLLRLDIISDTRARDQAAMNRICAGRFWLLGLGLGLGFLERGLELRRSQDDKQGVHVWLAKADAPAVEASNLHYHIMSWEVVVVLLQCLQVNSQRYRAYLSVMHGGLVAVRSELPSTHCRCRPVRPLRLGDGNARQRAEATTTGQQQSVPLGLRGLSNWPRPRRSTATRPVSEDLLSSLGIFIQ